MQTLKNEQKQIPNGFFFRQPEIKWDSRKVIGLHPSLDSLTRSVISARRANPHYVAQHKWSLDFNTVKQEVKQFNVKVCISMGWNDYLTDPGGDAPPFSKAQSLLNQKQLGAAVEKVKKLWAGIRTISEWLESNAPAVSSDLSESRAQICLQCPYNNTEALTEWFITPAAASIKKQLERLQERNLRTSVDDKIGICAQKKSEGNGGCLCSLPLSVHVPIELKLKHLGPEVKATLHSGCWVLSEEKGLQTKSA